MQLDQGIFEGLLPDENSEKLTVGHFRGLCEAISHHLPVDSDESTQISRFRFYGKTATVIVYHKQCNTAIFIVYHKQCDIISTVSKSHTEIQSMVLPCSTIDSYYLRYSAILHVPHLRIDTSPSSLIRHSCPCLVTTHSCLPLHHHS